MNGMPEVDRYVKNALKAFLNDPPTSEHQRGYMSALMEVARHALEWREDHEVLVEARKVYNKSLR